MMRTLTFQIINDTRFVDNPEKWVNDISEQIEQKLNACSGVSVRTEKTRRVVFPGNTISYRKRFYVNKVHSPPTWNDIYNVVNSVKAVPYSWL